MTPIEKLEKSAIYVKSEGKKMVSYDAVEEYLKTVDPNAELLETVTKLDELFEQLTVSIKDISLDEK